MDIEKLFKEFVEKEWHDGHEPQGGYDHYDEDEEVEEARTYIDRKYEKKKKGITPQSQKKKRWGSGGYGKGEEVEESEEDEAYGGTAKKKKSQKILKSKGYFHRKDRPAGWVEDSEVEEGYKDLPPHLQKLVKKIEKKQKDWNKQNPDAKITTLVYNPETGKPDIVVKENTMKLEDTVKQVLTKEPKLEEHCGVCDEQGIKEDDDKDEPGTQGDNAEYQKKRKAVAKKFGVSDCSQLDGAKKKACYKALDDAHVADHEEQVELKKMKKEETQKTFSKMFSHIKSLMQGK